MSIFLINIFVESSIFYVNKDFSHFYEDRQILVIFNENVYQITVWIAIVYQLFLK